MCISLILSSLIHKMGTVIFVLLLSRVEEEGCLETSSKKQRGTDMRTGCGGGGWGWVGKGQRELCGTNVLYFDGSGELPEYMHLSKLIKMYIEDLCVPLHVNYTPLIQDEKQNWTNESYHQGSATSLL